METKVWKKNKYSYPHQVPTMISNEEKHYLYWLGKSIWSGEGIVIEIGPWLGGSTVCLSAGMKESGYNSHKKLKVFDNFIWRKFMGDRVPLKICPGESFKSYFQKNISEFDEIVDSHAMTLPDEVIINDKEAQEKRFSENENVPLFKNLYNDPIKILFIDGAKSWMGMLHLLKIINNNLIPGRSYLVCQDYKYWGTYWVPIMMGRLKDYLKPVHNVLSATTVTFCLTSKIPLELLESFENNVEQLDVVSTLKEIEYAAMLLMLDGDKLGAESVLLTKVGFLFHKGEFKDMVDAFNRSQNSWGLFHPKWQLERAREYLKTEKSIEIKPLRSHRFVFFMIKCWGFFKGKIILVRKKILRK